MMANLDGQEIRTSRTRESSFSIPGKLFLATNPTLSTSSFDIMRYLFTVPLNPIF